MLIDGEGEGHAFLTDIGMNSLDDPGSLTSLCRWQAPEICLPDDEVAVAAPTAASDVYSTASTILEVCHSIDAFFGLESLTAVLYFTGAYAASPVQ